MTNKPRAIGTAGESGCVKALVANGFPYAERRSLRGTLDAGDITGTIGLCWEVKSGKAAKTASDAQVAAWLRETETERVNARADIGILILARAGISPNRAAEWWAVLHLHQINPFTWHDAPVRMLLRDACNYLRELGYGSPLPEPCIEDVA